MTTLALIFDSQIIKTVPSGGWLALPNGDHVSPPVAGWENDGYRLDEIADADPVPEGMASAGVFATMVNGEVQWVHQLVDARTVMPALTARQIRLGLISNGISLASVEAAIAAIEDAEAREKAQVEWEYASEYQRTNPLIAAIGSALDMTDQQIDAMWVQAVSL